MRYSLLLPISPQRPEQLVPFANLVKWTHADRLWQGHGLVLDSHHLASWLSGIGIRVPVGFGVSLMPLRSPYQAAVEARSAALTTGHSVVAGFGPGAVEFQRSVLGKPYRSQLGACREYAEIVRELLAGEFVQSTGEHFSVHAELTPYHSTPVSVGLGVLREKMAALAGEIADVAVTWMAPASYLDTVLMPAMRSAPGRVTGKAPTVTAIVPVALSGPERKLDDLAGVACGAHLRFPHYQDALRSAGVPVAGDGAGEDLRKLVDAGVFLYGTAEEIHERLAEFRMAGVDELVLNASGVGHVLGPRAAATDLLEILNAAPTM